MGVHRTAGHPSGYTIVALDSYSLVSQIWQIYTSEVKMKKIYIFKHDPPLPLPHSFGPGTFALHSHYNPLFEKILYPPLEGYLSWIKILFQHSFILMYC